MRYLRLGLLVAALAAVLGPYLALDRETQTLDATARAALGGSYVELPRGVTHYELRGPADGPLVVLVHGGTVPFFTWDAQMPVLLEFGYRVLRYDHFGRGYSDRPRLTYDRALYQKQLEDLLAALGIGSPFHLVGVSFGGAVAATFAAANPERVAKLVLIAPVVDYTEGRALFRMAKIPLLGEWYARVFGVRATVARVDGFFEESGADPSYAQRFEEQTRFEGYEQALLSMARADALTSYRETYAGLGDQPKLLLWGTADTEIPREHMDFIAKKAGNVSFVKIEGAGHGLNVQRKEEVNRRIVEFLRGDGG